MVPETLEDRLRANWLISQRMVVGDRRPFIACLVTLDPRLWRSGNDSISGPSAPLPVSWQ